MSQVIVLEDKDQILNYLLNFDKIILDEAGYKETRLFDWLRDRGVIIRSFINCSNNKISKSIEGIAVKNAQALSSWKHEALIILCDTSLNNNLELIKQLGFEHILLLKESFLNNLNEKPIYIQNNEKYFNKLNSIKDKFQNQHKKENSADVLLLSPPAWDMYTPFGAVPCLTAALKQDNIKVKQYDIGILCFHYLLQTSWEKYAERYININYYESKVKKYMNNPYETYEDYVKDLWFLQEKIFPIDNVKNNYYTLNRVQIGVLDSFYQVVASKLSINIDFNLNENFVETLERYDKNLLIDTIVNSKVLEEIVNVPKAVGISITGTNQFIPACALAEIIRYLNPETRIFVGGSCVDVLLTSYYKNKRDITKFFDLVISGEGETAVKKCVKYILGNKETKISDIPNLVLFKDNGDVIIPEVFLEDVNLLPPPCFDDVDFSLYLAPKAMLPYQTSRGCHYGHCAFCNHNSKYRHNYRTKNMKKVISDLLYMMNRYSINYFQFVDEAIRPDCFIDMVNEMDNYKEFKEIKWIYYSRVNFQYNNEVLIKAKKNGCEMVMFGVETFNQRLLNFIKKGISADASQYCIELFDKNKIKTFIWLMCNLPSETIDEMRGDIKKVNDNIKYLSGINVGPFYLDVNTDMYRNMEAYNITGYDPYDGTRFTSVNEGVEIDKDETFKIYSSEYRSLINKYFFTNNRYTIFYDGLGVE